MSRVFDTNHTIKIKSDKLMDIQKEQFQLEEYEKRICLSLLAETNLSVKIKLISNYSRHTARKCYVTNTLCNMSTKCSTKRNLKR